MDPASIPTWAAGLLAASVTLRLGVGGWVIWRAAQTRGAQELVIGGFIAMLALGELLVVAATRLRGHATPEVTATLGAVGLMLLVAACLVMAEGLRRLFRAHHRGLRGALVAFGAVVVAAAWQRASEGGAGVVVAHGGLANALLLTALLALDLWWAGESFATSSRLRRQAAIGLASPDAGRRFQLWGIAAVAHATVAVALLVCAVVLRRPAVEVPGVLAWLGAAGAICAVAVYASFHLPSFLHEAPSVSERA